MLQQGVQEEWKPRGGWGVGVGCVCAVVCVVVGTVRRWCVVRVGFCVTFFLLLQEVSLKIK